MFVVGFEEPSAPVAIPKSCLQRKPSLLTELLSAASSQSPRSDPVPVNYSQLRDRYAKSVAGTPKSHALDLWQFHYERQSGHS